MEFHKYKITNKKMLRRWVNTVIPSNCRMVKMYNTRCEGTTAASENCHITHFSTQSFQFSVLILPQFRAKTTILYHLDQLFRQKIVSPAFPVSSRLGRSRLGLSAGDGVVCVHNRRQGGALTTHISIHRASEAPPSARPQL